MLARYFIFQPRIEEYSDHKTVCMHNLNILTKLANHCSKSHVL